MQSIAVICDFPVVVSDALLLYSDSEVIVLGDIRCEYWTAGINGSVVVFS